MNVIAIETATPACAVALRTANGVERSLIVADERHHTEALTPGIRELLSQADLSARAIDRVVVDRGPGLFTGLRVGLATAVGLALGANAELVGVTSLEVLAHGAWSGDVRGLLLCAVDARRGEIFVQSFELDDGVVALDQPSVALPDSVIEAWAERDEPVTFSGDGVVRYEAEFRAVRSGAFFEQRIPSPLEALRLGAERPVEDEMVPLYLREADAVANFSTRERLP
ncbi:MAG: tRNA (adenosine(37)-N6)-threonylcarbamoyltransferase complex dimerization subunit type 1 TsaB [Acidimicrobiales bacterium]